MSARDIRHAESSDEQPTDEDRAGAPQGPIRFEGIREVVVMAPPAPDAAPDAAPDVSREAPGEELDASKGALLDSLQITCQAGGGVHGGDECKQCARFVNWVPSPDHSKVTIRCLWSERDVVGDLMACIAALVTTRPDTPMTEAAALARQLQASYLLVERDGYFEGVIYAHDMSAGALVRDRMVRPAWSVPPNTTLGDAVTIMRAHGTDFLPVVGHGALLGVITRAELVEAGLESALHGAPP